MVSLLAFIVSTIRLVEAAYAAWKVPTLSAEKIPAISNYRANVPSSKTGVGIGAK